MKLRDLWNKAVRVSLGQGKLKDKERFTEKLDKLVDILNCKCKIFLCSEFHCEEDCVAQAHIQCTCKKEQKIPVLDLAFIKAQSDKTGSTSSYQIGLPDYPETRRQVNALRNREEKRQKQERR